MTFAEKLVKLRKLKGITQDEFASAVGVSRQAVYKWESGQSYPEVAKLLEMKLLFTISLDDLLDENYEVVLPEKKRRRRKTKEQKEAEALAAAAAAVENAEAAAPKAEPKVEAKVEPKVEAKPQVKEEPKAAPKAEPKKKAKKEEKTTSIWDRLRALRK
jgi:transcriptional regulator with XRE-family HTH domain